MSDTTPAVVRRLRILVIEDHPVFLQGLVNLLGLEPDFEVVGHASGRREALDAVDALHPELALVDLSLGEDNGLDLIKDILFRAPQTRLLVLSMYDEDIYRRRSRAAGAHGHCHKGESVEVMLDAIRTVAGGQNWHEPAREQNEPQLQDDSATNEVLKALTDREFEVLGLIGKGLGTAEIASKLRISGKTVETYKANLKTKLKAPTSQELRRWAVSWQAGQLRIK